MSFESGVMSRVRTIEAKKDINEKFIVEEQFCCCAEEIFFVLVFQKMAPLRSYYDIAV